MFATSPTTYIRTISAASKHIVLTKEMFKKKPKEEEHEVNGDTCGKMTSTDGQTAVCQNDQVASGRVPVSVRWRDL